MAADTQFIRTTARMLDYLNPAQKRLLGIEGLQVTERMVSHRFNHFAELVDPSVHHHPDKTEDEVTEAAARLQDVCDRLCDASVEEDMPEWSGDAALDGTLAECWGRKRKQNYPDVLEPDPDAAWTGAKGGVFGYNIQYLTRIGPDGGGVIPQQVHRMTIGAASAVEHRLALPLLTDMANRGVVGDLIFDRGYSGSTENFVEPARELGFELTFDLNQNQRGRHGVTPQGAVLIDGFPHDPYTPDLWDEPESIHKNDGAGARATKYAEFEKRRRYALPTKGSRRADGAQQFFCPAEAGKVSCKLKPASVGQLRGLPIMAVPTVVPHLICGQKTVLIDAADMPLIQKHYYGSEDWWDSWKRRSMVELTNACVKDMASEKLRRGTNRFLGLAKFTLTVAFATAAMNLRLADSWRRGVEEAKTAGIAKVRRRKRRRTLAREAYSAAKAQGADFEDRVAAASAARAGP